METQSQSQSPGTACSYEVAMVSAARDGKLFEGNNMKLWFVAFPPEDYKKKKPPPPPSEKSYEIKQIHTLDKSCRGPMEAVAYIGKGIDSIFSVPETLVNGTFWSKFVTTLLYELTNTGGLVEGYERSEAEVSTDLLVPLLSKIAHADKKIGMACTHSSLYVFWTWCYSILQITTLAIHILRRTVQTVLYIYMYMYSGE